MGFEKSHYHSCYSGSVVELLSRRNIIMEEEELFVSDHLLKIECKSISDGICSDLKRIVDSRLKEYGISFENISITTFDNLLDCLKKYGPLLMHVDSKKLSYSDVFAKEKTCQSMHYIILENVIKNQLYIYDSYVPGAYVKTYQGDIILQTNELHDIEFYRMIVDSSKDIHRECSVENRIKNILEIPQSKEQQEAFDQFIKNLELILNSDCSVQQKQYYFYEAATAVFVSGVISTRKVLGLLLEKHKLLSFELLNNIKRLENKYVNLRMLLLKLYICYKQESLLSLISIIKKIHDYEVEQCTRAIEELNLNIDKEEYEKGK